MVYLVFNNRLFHESDDDNNSHEAALVIDEANKKMTLKFSGECGFVIRRTAERQARGIQKTGFVSNGNNRIGMDYELTIEGGNEVPDRLTHSPRKVY